MKHIKLTSKRIPSLADIKPSEECGQCMDKKTKSMDVNDAYQKCENKGICPG